MKKTVLLFILFAAFGSQTASAGFLDKMKQATEQMNQYSAQQQQQQAQAGGTYSGGGSLSAGLGATQLGAGINNFANCQTATVGYHESLTADRLEAKLANTPGLSPQERGEWAADIAALRRVWQTHDSRSYVPPDPKDPQRYLLGLTDPEQVAINQKTNHLVQETNLKCEHLYGSMSRYSSANGAVQSNALQDDYENSLRQNIQPDAELSSIPLEPLPSRDPSVIAALQQKKRADRRAAQKAAQQAGMQKLGQCAQSGKGLRIKLIAQALQRKFESSTGLNPQQKAEFQADVQAAWAAAGQGLDMIPPADPKNPMRAEQRLGTQELLDINSEYFKQYSEVMQNCVGTPGAAG